MANGVSKSGTENQGTITIGEITIVGDPSKAGEVSDVSSGDEVQVPIGPPLATAEDYNKLVASPGSAAVDVNASLDADGLYKADQVEGAKKRLHQQVLDFKKTKEYRNTLKGKDKEATPDSINKLWLHLNGSTEFRLLSPKDKKAFLESEGFTVDKNPSGGSFSRSFVKGLVEKVGVEMNSTNLHHIWEEVLDTHESSASRRSFFLKVQAAALEKAGKPEEAARTYERALKEVPEDHNTRICWARALLAWAKKEARNPDPKVSEILYAKAKEVLAPALKADPKNWPAKTLQAQIDLFQKYPSDSAASQAFVRKEFDENLKLYEGLANRDENAAKACLEYLAVLQPRLVLNPKPKSLAELEDQIRINKFALGCVSKKVGNFEDLQQSTIETITKTINALRKDELKFEGDPLELSKRTVEILTQDLKLPDWDTAQFLDKWQKQVEQTPAAKLSDDARLKQYTEIMKHWIRIRDKASTGDRTVMVDSGEAKAKLDALRKQILAIAGKVVNAPAANEKINVLLNRIIEGNDLKLFEFVSVQGFKTFVEGSGKCDAELEKAKLISDPKEKRKALMGVLDQAKLLRDSGRVDEVVKLIEATVADAKTPPEDKLKTYIDLARSLEGSGFPAAGSMETKALSQAKSLWDSLKDSKATDASSVRQLLLIADFMNNPRFEKGTEIAGLAKEKIKTIRNCLVKSLDGQIESGVEIKTEEERKTLDQVKTLTDSKERMKAAALLVDLDRVMLGDYLAEAGDDAEKKNALGSRMAADFKRWQAEIKNNQDLSPAERRDQLSLLMGTALYLESLASGTKPLFKDSSYKTEVQGATQQIEKDLATDVNSQVKAAFDELFPVGQITDFDRKQMWDRFKRDFAPQFHKAVEQAREKHKLEGILNFTSKDFLTQLVRDWKKADSFVMGFKDPPTPKDLENSFTAAQIFGDLGMSERVTEALIPLNTLAHHSKVPVKDRVDLLNLMAQAYQGAGMTKEANGMLDEVIAFGADPKAAKEIKEQGVIAKAMQHLNRNELEKAEEILVTLPKNETAKSLLHGLQEGRKRFRNLQIMGMLRAYYDSYEEGFREGTKRPWLADLLTSSKTKGREAGALYELHTHRDLLDQVEQRMMIDGYDLDQAVSMTRIQTGEWPSEVNALFDGFHRDLNIAANDLSGGIASRTLGKNQRNIAWVSDLRVSEADFGRVSIRFAEYLKETGRFNAATTVAQIASENKFVASRANQLLDKEIPDAVFWDGVGKAIFKTVGDMTIIGADTPKESLKGLVITVACMGVGRVLAAGAEAIYAARAAKAVQAGVEARTALVALRMGINAERAAVISARMGSYAMRFGGWFVKSGAEALGFSYMEMKIHGENITLKSFSKKWAGMMVTFGLGHAAGMRAAGRGSGAQWAAGVGSFFVSGYINEGIGLAEKSHEHWSVRLVGSITGDASMRMAGWLFNKGTGGALHRVEQRTQQIYHENQYLSVADRFGINTQRNWRGELNESAQRILHGLMVNAQARGLNLADMADRARFLSDLTRHLSKEHIDQVVKDLGHDPASPASGDIRGAVLGHLLAHAARVMPHGGEVLGFGRIEGAGGGKQTFTLSTKQLLADLPAKMKPLFELKLPSDLKMALLEEALHRGLNEAETKALAEQAGEVHKAFQSLVAKLGDRASLQLIRLALRGAMKIEDVSKHLKALTGQLEKLEQSLKEGLKGKLALGDKELKEVMEKLLNTALELSLLEGDPKSIEKILSTLVQDFIEARKTEMKMKKALEQAYAEAKKQSEARRVQAQRERREREKRDQEDEFSSEGVDGKKRKRAGSDEIPDEGRLTLDQAIRIGRERLGLGQGEITPNAVKKAYNQWVRENHPDRRRAERLPELPNHVYSEMGALHSILLRDVCKAEIKDSDSQKANDYLAGKITRTPFRSVRTAAAVESVTPAERPSVEEPLPALPEKKEIFQEEGRTEEAVTATERSREAVSSISISTFVSARNIAQRAMAAVATVVGITLISPRVLAAEPGVRVAEAVDNLQRFTAWMSEVAQRFVSLPTGIAVAVTAVEALTLGAALGFVVARELQKDKRSASQRRSREPISGVQERQTQDGEGGGQKRRQGKEDLLGAIDQYAPGGPASTRGFVMSDRPPPFIQKIIESHPGNYQNHPTHQAWSGVSQNFLHGHIVRPIRREGGHVEFQQLRYSEATGNQVMVEPVRHPITSTHVEGFLWLGRALVQSNPEWLRPLDPAHRQNLNREFEFGASIHAIEKGGQVRFEKVRVTPEGQVLREVCDLAQFEAYLDFIETTYKEAPLPNREAVLESVRAQARKGLWAIRIQNQDLPRKDLEELVSVVDVLIEKVADLAADPFTRDRAEGFGYREIEKIKEKLGLPSHLSGFLHQAVEGVVRGGGRGFEKAPAIPLTSREQALQSPLSEAHQLAGALKEAKVLKASQFPAFISALDCLVERTFRRAENSGIKPRDLAQKIVEDSSETGVAGILLRFNLQRKAGVKAEIVALVQQTIAAARRGRKASESIGTSVIETPPVVEPQFSQATPSPAVPLTPRESLLQGLFIEARNVVRLVKTGRSLDPARIPELISALDFLVERTLQRAENSGISTQDLLRKIVQDRSEAGVEGLLRRFGLQGKAGVKAELVTVVVRAVKEGSRIFEDLKPVQKKASASVEEEWQTVRDDELIHEEPSGVRPLPENLDAAEAQILLKENTPDSPRQGTVGRDQPTPHYGSFSMGTHPGKGYKPHNEDAATVLFAAVRDASGRVIGERVGGQVVADGVGGGKNGAEASRRACQIITDEMRAHQEFQTVEELQAALKAALQQAHETVRAEYPDAGTTVVAQWIFRGREGKDFAVIAHVGDSSAWVLSRDGRIKHHLKHDSTVQNEYEKHHPDTTAPGALRGEPDPQAELEMRADPRANEVTQALGMGRFVREADGSVRELPLEVHIDAVPLENGDYLILGTDGLGDLVGSGEIKARVKRGGSPEEIQKDLLDLPLHKMEVFDMTCKRRWGDLEAGKRVKVKIKGREGWLEAEKDHEGDRSVFNVYDAPVGGKLIDHLKADNATVSVYRHDVAEAQGHVAEIKSSMGEGEGAVVIPLRRKKTSGDMPLAIAAKAAGPAPDRADRGFRETGGYLRKLAGWLGIAGAAGLATTAFLQSAEAAVQGGHGLQGRSLAAMAFGAIFAFGTVISIKGRRGKASQAALEGSEKAPEEAFMERALESFTEDLLVEGLQHENPSIVKQTADLLGNQSVRWPWLMTAEVTDLLMKNLQHPQPEVADAVREVLEKIVESPEHLKPDFPLAEVKSRLGLATREVVLPPPGGEEVSFRVPIAKGPKQEILEEEERVGDEFRKLGVSYDTSIPDYLRKTVRELREKAHGPEEEILDAVEKDIARVFPEKRIPGEYNPFDYEFRESAQRLLGFVARWKTWEKYGASSMSDMERNAFFHPVGTEYGVRDSGIRASDARVPDARVPDAFEISAGRNRDEASPLSPGSVGDASAGGGDRPTAKIPMAGDRPTVPTQQKEAPAAIAARGAEIPPSERVEADYERWGVNAKLGDPFMEPQRKMTGVDKDTDFVGMLEGIEKEMTMGLEDLRAKIHQDLEAVKKLSEDSPEYREALRRVTQVLELRLKAFSLPFQHMPKPILDLLFKKVAEIYSPQPVAEPSQEAPAASPQHAHLDLAVFSGMNLEAAKAEYERRKNSPERSALQEAIVDEFLKEGISSEHPTLIYMAGAPGAGKSTVLHALKAAGYLEADQMLLLDIDRIRERIPEYRALKGIDASQAAAITHAEGGNIKELLFERAIERKKNIIEDGTLRNMDFFTPVMTKVTTEHPEYRILFMEVEASLELSLARTKSRAAASGRHVPEAFVIDSKKMIPLSVQTLSRFADAVITINNDVQPVIKSFFKHGRKVVVDLEVPLKSNHAWLHYQIEIPIERISETSSLGTLDQIKAAKRVVRIQSGRHYKPLDLQNRLESLEPSQHWNIVQGQDPQATPMMKVAEKMGFQTLAFGNAEEPHQAINPASTFNLLFATRKAQAKAWAELGDPAGHPKGPPIDLDYSVPPDLAETLSDHLKDKTLNMRKEARDAMFHNYFMSLERAGEKKADYGDLTRPDRNYGLRVLEGYGTLGYENPAAVRDHLKDQMRRAGDGTVYVMGGISKGIGEVYDWIPEIARELGYQNVLVDKQVAHWNVEDKGRSLMVAIAEDTGGEIIYFKGGDVAGSEMREALERGIPVTLITDPQIAPSAKNVAKQLIKHPRMVLDGTSTIAGRAGRYPNLTVVDQAPTPPSAVSSAPVVPLRRGEKMTASSEEAAVAAKGAQIPPSERLEGEEESGMIPLTVRAAHELAESGKMNALDDAPSEARQKASAHVSSYGRGETHDPSFLSDYEFPGSINGRSAGLRIPYEGRGPGPGEIPARVLRYDEKENTLTVETLGGEPRKTYRVLIPKGRTSPFEAGDEILLGRHMAGGSVRPGEGAASGFFIPFVQHSDGSWHCEIGRAAFPHLSPTVSPRHAEIVWHQNKLWLFDLGSESGTILHNETMVKSVFIRKGQAVGLKAGDVIQLGEEVLRVVYQNQRWMFLPVKDSSSAAIQLPPGVPLERSPLKGGEMPQIVLPRGTAPGEMVWVLGSFRGQKGPLAGNYYKIPAASVSRRHAQIRIREGAMTIKDLGSYNGTYVWRAATGQWERIGEEAVAIARDDLVVLGGGDETSAVRISFGPDGSLYTHDTFDQWGDLPRTPSKIPAHVREGEGRKTEEAPPSDEKLKPFPIISVGEGREARTKMPPLPPGSFVSPDGSIPLASLTSSSEGAPIILYGSDASVSHSSVKYPSAIVSTQAEGAKGPTPSKIPPLAYGAIHRAGQGWELEVKTVDRLFVYRDQKSRTEVHLQENGRFPLEDGNVVQIVKTRFLFHAEDGTLIPLERNPSLMVRLNSQPLAVAAKVAHPIDRAEEVEKPKVTLGEISTSAIQPTLVQWPDGPPIFQVWSRNGKYYLQLTEAGRRGEDLTITQEEREVRLTPVSTNKLEPGDYKIRRGDEEADFTLPPLSEPPKEGSSPDEDSPQLVFRDFFGTGELTPVPQPDGSFVMKGPRFGLEVKIRRLSDGSYVLLDGRSPSEVDTRVRKGHARILSDTRREPVVVNDKTVTPGVETPVRSGDLVILGALEGFTFHIREVTPFEKAMKALPESRQKAWAERLEGVRSLKELKELLSAGRLNGGAEEAQTIDACLKGEKTTDSLSPLVRRQVLKLMEERARENKAYLPRGYRPALQNMQRKGMAEAEVDYRAVRAAQRLQEDLSQASSLDEVIRLVQESPLENPEGISKNILTEALGQFKKKKLPIQQFPRGFGIRQKLRDLQEAKMHQVHFGGADTAPVSQRGSSTPAEIERLDQTENSLYGYVSQAIRSGRSFQGPWKKLKHGEMMELVYQVLHRGQPIEKITKEHGIRDQIEAHMGEVIRSAERLCPQEIFMARDRNYFTGESIRDLDTRYRFARMLLNQKAGRPIFGAPTQHEVIQVLEFATRLLKVPGLKTYEEAQMAIRDHFARFTSELQAALSDPLTSQELKALVIEAFFGSSQHRQLDNPRQAFQLARFLGKIGFYREVGVTVEIIGEELHTNISLGDLGSVSPEDRHIFFVLHTHPEHYENERGGIMGTPSYSAGGKAHTVLVGAGKKSSDTTGVLFSSQDVRLFVADAVRVFETAGYNQKADLSIFYDRRRHIFKNWVQHPYGFSEIQVHVDPSTGKAMNVEIRYWAEDGQDPYKGHEHQAAKLRVLNQYRDFKNDPRQGKNEAYGIPITVRRVTDPTERRRMEFEMPYPNQPQ